MVKNLPALISVTRGRPSSSSLRSTQKTPVASGSTAAGCRARPARSRPRDARCVQPTGSSSALGIRWPKTCSRRSRAARSRVDHPARRSGTRTRGRRTRSCKSAKCTCLPIVPHPRDSLVRRRDGRLARAPAPRTARTQACSSLRGWLQSSRAATPRLRAARTWASAGRRSPFARRASPCPGKSRPPRRSAGTSQPRRAHAPARGGAPPARAAWTTPALSASTTFSSSRMPGLPLGGGGSASTGAGSRWYALVSVPTTWNGSGASRSEWTKFAAAAAPPLR